MAENLYTEHGQFIESNGDMYCLADCNDCRFKNICEHEEADFCKDIVTPVRSIVKTHVHSHPYATEAESIDTPHRNGRFKGDSLPYSSKRVYKIIHDLPVPYKHRELDYIIFNKGKYYCMRQLCDTCEHQPYCKNEIEIKPYKDIICVVDASAQEPRAFVLSTKITGNLENNWVEVFYNDKIRALGKPYNTLETLFKMHGHDIKSHAFYRWVNLRFFYDKTDIYNLQTAVNLYYRDKTPQNLDNLKEVSESLIADYNSFLDKLTERR